MKRAQETGRAVGAFTCYDDLLGYEAVVWVAESYRTPVIVLVSPSSFWAEEGGAFEEDPGMKAATVNLESLGDGVVEAKLSAFGWTREEA